MDVNKANKTKEQSQKKMKTLELEKQEVEKEKDIKKSVLAATDKKSSHISHC